MSAVEEQILKPYHQTDRFSLYEGDCRSVLPLCRLKQGVRFAMTGMAESYEVYQLVSSQKIAVKKAIRTDVVNVVPRLKTMLAGIAVAFSSLPFLRLPVGATVARWSSQVLRMQYPDTISIPARARTKLALTSAVDCVTRGSLVLTATANAKQPNFLFKFSCDSDMLARGRARLTAPVFETSGRNREGIRACLTCNDNSHPSIIDQRDRRVYA